MKKIISILLCVLINLSSVTMLSAEYNENPIGIPQNEFDNMLKSDIISAIISLCDWNVVKNPNEKWSENDPITRRNAYEMAILVKAGGRKPRDLQNPSFIDEERALMLHGKFTDVQQGTYDLSLLDILYSDRMISGKTNDAGEKVAAFDDFLTYHEAFTILSRMLLNYYVFYFEVEETIKTWDVNYPYFKLAEEIGLINSNTLISYSSLTIDESQMDDYIPAHHFMYLLYQAMYIPIVVQDDFTRGLHSNRYIDHFMEFGPVPDHEPDPEEYDVPIP